MPIFFTVSYVPLIFKYSLKQLTLKEISRLTSFHSNWCFTPHCTVLSCNLFYFALIIISPFSIIQAIFLAGVSWILCKLHERKNYGFNFLEHPVILKTVQSTQLNNQGHILTRPAICFWLSLFFQMAINWWGED